MLWCKIKDTNDHDCLLLGIVYIPPEGSKYANDDNFEGICQDLIEAFDDDLFNNFNIDGEIRSKLINETNWNDLGITTDRFSQAVKMNNYGHRLFEMCKIVDIHICNGRLGNDAFCGKNTCKDASVVNYVLDCDAFNY